MLPKKAKKQVLPVIDEKKMTSFTKNVGDELADINSNNLQNKAENFTGPLPNGFIDSSSVKVLLLLYA